MHRCIVVACLFFTTGGIFTAHAAPTVNGNEVSWPDDGWYQLQNATTFESLCQGGLSCVVDAGTYIVINHTTGQRFEPVVVTASLSGPGIRIAGLNISWPDNGWYQVQTSDTYDSICGGGLTCQVTAGVYNIINHTTMQRFEDIAIDATTDLFIALDSDPGSDPGPDPVQPPDGELPAPQVPVLADPFADPLLPPDAQDPFGSFLEVDNETPLDGGPPTQPKNLRLDLVSNNWAEISWAPSNDDNEVVQYNIYRSDGVTYEIRRDQTDSSPGTQREIDKYWATTSFIDCNFTRFDTRVHNCAANQPEPGQTYTYEVTAVDDEGQESAASTSLSVTYFLDRNAPIPLYRDLYKAQDDRFVNETDLSAVDYWLDDFELVFADEFNGDAIDPDKWQTGLTWGDTRIINGEQQYFVNTQANPDFGYDPFSFTGESMIINAIPVTDELRDALPPVCNEPDPTGLDRCEFLSGALSSHDRFQFVYGYTEGRFKVSGARGALSSFYLYHRYAGEGVNFHAPEIDIVEYLGENPFGAADAFQTYHFGDPATGLTRSAPTMSFKKPGGGTYADNGQWHTFSVLWEPQLVIWYIDGREVKRLFGPQVSRQPMNIVNYLVAGSAWAPTPDKSDNNLFPLQFETDYIRVYQREPFKASARFGP